MGDGGVAVPRDADHRQGAYRLFTRQSRARPQCDSAAPTGAYWDWQLGADYAIRNTPLTVNLSWIDTDISRREAAYLQPSFSKGQDGRGSIAGSTLFASLTAAF